MGAALLPLAGLLLGCPPTMVEREGHRVFNPFYLPYLDADSREAWQRPERVLDALALPPDAVVADIGAGSGYFSVRLARRLPDGLVYATDVQEPMLERLRERHPFLPRQYFLVFAPAGARPPEPG